MASTGRIEKSILDYTEVIRITPHFALAFNNRGLALEATATMKSDQGLFGCNTAQARLCKGFGKTVPGCLRLPESRLRDGRRSRVSRKGMQLTNRAADWTIARLSAAYAETGHFDKAIRPSKSDRYEPGIDFGTRENMLERFRNGELFHQRNRIHE